MTTNFSIYQLNKENEKYLFMGYDFRKKNVIEISQYDLIWQGEHFTSSEDALEILDEIYFEFNSKRHPEGFKGHSLSTSDVVMVNGKFYFCDSYGWKELKNFEPKKQKSIRVKVNTTDESELRYFTVYNIIGIKHNGERVTIGTHMTEKKANEVRELYGSEDFEDIYRSTYVTSSTVWVD